MNRNVVDWKWTLARAAGLALALGLGSFAPPALGCDPNGDVCNPNGVVATCCNNCSAPGICCSRGQSVDGKVCMTNTACCTGHCHIPPPAQFGKCCSEADQACSSDSDCCPGAAANELLECDTANTQECCMPTDGTCTNGNQCCSGLCSLSGTGGGKCACSGTGKFCEANTDCCANLVCSNSTTRASVCCIPKGTACTNNAGCCSGVCLATGFCK
jgi:hypothetical protein